MILSILLLQGGLSCIHASPGLEASQETKPLDRLEVIDLGDRLRVAIEGQQPMTYSLSTSLTPASVTIYLPGFNKGSHLNSVDVNNPPILQKFPTRWRSQEKVSG